MVSPEFAPHCLSTKRQADIVASKHWAKQLNGDPNGLKGARLILHHDSGGDSFNVCTDFQKLDDQLQNSRIKMGKTPIQRDGNRWEVDLAGGGPILKIGRHCGWPGRNF